MDRPTVQWTRTERTEIDTHTGQLISNKEGKIIQRRKESSFQQTEQEQVNMHMGENDPSLLLNAIHRVSSRWITPQNPPNPGEGKGL